jgi:hypothetical protein
MRPAHACSPIPGRLHRRPRTLDNAEKHRPDDAANFRVHDVRHSRQCDVPSPPCTIRPDIPPTPRCSAWRNHQVGLHQPAGFVEATKRPSAPFCKHTSTFWHPYRTVGSVSLNVMSLFILAVVAITLADWLVTFRLTVEHDVRWARVSDGILDGDLHPIRDAGAPDGRTCVRDASGDVEEFSARRSSLAFGRRFLTRAATQR